ncbi:hypothetical protein [Pseudomonas sp. TMB3-21]
MVEILSQRFSKTSLLTIDGGKRYRQTDIKHVTREFSGPFVRCFAVLFDLAVSPAEGKPPSLACKPKITFL